MSGADKYQELKISPFHVPFLRDLGIKTVSMVQFDIIFGPVCYIKELSRSIFGEKLKDVSSLAEIYTGFARTNADVITSLEERVVIGRYITIQEEVEQIVVLLFICVPSANLDKLARYARSLSERTQGRPQLFDDALTQLIDAEKNAAYKIPLFKNGTTMKGLVINDKSEVTGNELNNFHGFLFIPYHKGTIDGRFFPKMIDGKRIEFSHLFKFIDIQKNEADLREGDLISLYYKGLELLVYRHLKKDALMVGAKKPQSKINYSYLDDWFTILFNSYINIPGESKVKSTLEAISYLDKNISKQPKKYIVTEIMDLIINSEDDYPELSVSPKNLQEKGSITLDQKFQLFLENLSLLEGNTSIHSISQDLSVPISSVIEFIIFLKSRGFVDVYRRK